jgi:CheY-like chemotaxis protein
MAIEQQQRVLVIDDDRATRQMLIGALRRKSLIIDEAANGREALDLLRENAYSVVLLDILMPELNGFEVLDAIGTEMLSAPVVLVVSGVDRNVLDRLDSERIHGIVRKPFDPLEVAAVVAACAEIRGNRGFEAMAIATMVTGAQLMALWKL